MRATLSLMRREFSAYFVSPIGYRPDLMPESLRFTLYFNPIFYLTRVFRAALLAGEPAGPGVWAVFAVMSLGTFAVGSAFFHAFKDKWKFEGLLSNIPVSIILNESAPLLGAAYEALAASNK